MKLLNSKDGDLLSSFDKIKENNTDNTCLKEIIINNHDIDAKKGRING